MATAAAQLTKGGSGPSGMDADVWRKMLASRDHGSTGDDFRVAFALDICTMFTCKVDDMSISVLVRF